MHGGAEGGADSSALMTLQQTGNNTTHSQKNEQDIGSRVHVPANHRIESNHRPIIEMHGKTDAFADDGRTFSRHRSFSLERQPWPPVGATDAPHGVVIIHVLPQARDSRAPNKLMILRRFHYYYYYKR